MILLLALTLFEQSTARLLELRYSGPAVSYLLADARTGVVIAERWADAQTPQPMGSLVKPFLAARIPPSTRFRCDGRHCWRVKGHGDIGLVEALAYSCNAYFLAAAVKLGSDTMPETLIGLGEEWKLKPAELAEAYRVLLSRADVAPIRQGMKLAATNGTGRLARVNACVKTGTAPCSHAVKAAGDGLVVIADERYILTMRLHGTTGSAAAQLAGGMWRAVHERH